MKAFTALALASLMAACLGGGRQAAANPPPIHPAKTPAAKAAPAPHAVAPVGTASPVSAAAHPAAARPASAAGHDTTPPGPPALTAVLPAGPVRDTLIRLFLKPYADATGSIAVADPAWDGASLDAALKPAAGGTPDLILVTGAQLDAGCRAQTLARLDWSTLGRDRYLPQAVGDCGAGAYLAAVALAWDRDKLPQTPDWPDFWDVARHPGGRGLPRTARFDLEIALLADGVAAADIYRTLRTTEGLDRAFRKLDQLKPYILWWDKPDQPAHMLAAGHVLLTASPSFPLLQTSDATHRAYGLQWKGSLISVQSWAIPQGAPHPAAAQAGLLIAADIARQADFARLTGLGPTIRAAIDLLPPGPRAASPAAPHNLQDALFIDEGFWLENQDKLQARFDAWASKE
jgi:putative spermidine/putrescine transport system substrate-binding protein